MASTNYFRLLWERVVSTGSRTWQSAVVALGTLSLPCSNEVSPEVVQVQERGWRPEKKKRAKTEERTSPLLDKQN